MSLKFLLAILFDSNPLSGGSYPRGITITHNFVGSSVAFTYGYNLVHEPLTQTVSDSTYMWHPSSAGTVAYGTADNVNKYPTVGGTSYSYNGNKCLTGDGIWTYGFDTENHLLTAVKTGTSASFVYDPMHRQSQKTVGSTKTRYIYSGWQRIADYNGTSGAIQNRYVYGVGIDEPLIQVTSAGVLTFLHHDKMGSIVGVSNAAGAIANKNKFSPFGEITTLGGTTFGFTGQRYDSELGLHYFKGRYMSAKLGRFLQPDHVGYTGLDFNLYTYVGNSPLLYTDPMGLQRCWSEGTGDGSANGHESHPGPQKPEDGDWTKMMQEKQREFAEKQWERIMIELRRTLDRIAPITTKKIIDAVNKALQGQVEKNESFKSELGEKKPKTTDYTLKEGDTLWDIAKEKLGDNTRWGEIARLNGIPDGSQYGLPIGLTISIPSK